tara:strand:- start:444 stop:1256 length:813 start_codon:yes stop_codon:yes gene_type:complete
MIAPHKNLVLFDMDGTITPARKPIEWEMVKVLARLSKLADIGIVTGSGFDYLVEQCKTMWTDIGSVPMQSISLMPCNGTQLFLANKFRWDLTHAEDMRKSIGKDKYRELVSIILGVQKKLVKRPMMNLPFTGNFISYRQSLLNWCPIGRDANDEDRKEFKLFDKEHGYRMKAKKKLEKTFVKRGIVGLEIALGGQTSLDIFPKGWNKSFALTHFPGRDIWFVGDRCTGGGNDHAIYDELKKKDKAFQTVGPKETIQIIEELIIPNLQVGI